MTPIRNRTETILGPHALVADCGALAEGSWRKRGGQTAGSNSADWQSDGEDPRTSRRRSPDGGALADGSCRNAVAKPPDRMTPIRNRTARIVGPRLAGRRRRCPGGRLVARRGGPNRKRTQAMREVLRITSLAANPRNLGSDSAAAQVVTAWPTNSTAAEPVLGDSARGGTATELPPTVPVAGRSRSRPQAGHGLRHLIADPVIHATGARSHRCWCTPRCCLNCRVSGTVGGVV